MATSKDSSPAPRASSPPEEGLPAGFSTIRHILDLPNDVVRAEAEFNVFGVLKDFQVPFQTKGTDWKCALEIMDHSMEGENHGLKINIFWPIDKMPTLVNLADLIIVRRAKVQMFKGAISLKASYLSEFHILNSGSVPRTPREAKSAAWSSYTRKQKTLPTPTETLYAAWLHSRSSDLELPSDTEFKAKAETSMNMNVRDKFRLLKDLKEAGPQNYANLIGQVVKLHDSGGEMLELYMSDYTSNPAFYNYVWGAEGDDNDEFGYLRPQTKPKKLNGWPGPYGKLSIQVALWEPHASWSRDEVRVGQWVQLRNVRIKIGSSGFLEGVIHKDSSVKVDILKQNKEGLTSNSTPTEIRLQDAIERKFSWTQQFEKQQRAIRNEDVGPGDKRKRDEEDEILGDSGKRLNSKARRKQERAIAEKKVEQARLKKLKLGNLNQNIRCNFPERDATSLKEILRARGLDVEDKKVLSPFSIAKYRANVRVVDYFPNNIEEFAVGWRSSEFDAIEDFSGLEDTDVERSRKTWQSGQGHPKDQWEWRFALQVEDAECEGSNEKLWLIVDNASAQMLLNLEDDATSLRTHPELLAQLKEQLFKLWGDLEERKSAALQKAPIRKPSKSLPSTIDANVIPSSPPPRLGIMPTSTDSDDENVELPKMMPASSQKSIRAALEERAANSNIVAGGEGSGNPILKAKNKGFPCCIQQYGVKVKEGDPAKANAGEGRRWQRMFGLISTMID